MNGPTDSHSNVKDSSSDPSNPMIMTAQGHMIRGTQQTASGGRLIDSQSIVASGNVINNNFNIINNFVGGMPAQASNVS